jgi:hypothetical protein
MEWAVKFLLANAGEIGRPEKFLGKIRSRSSSVVGRQRGTSWARWMDTSSWPRALLNSPVWDMLFPHERSRVLYLLLESAVYGGIKGDLEFRFYP